MKNYTLVGVGITPEGINQNYVMYDFALDRAWYQNSVDVDKWLQVRCTVHRIWFRFISSISVGCTDISIFMYV